MIIRVIPCPALSAFVITFTVVAVYRYSCLKRFFFQAEDGIRDVERSRGLGDVYKRQIQCSADIKLISRKKKRFKQL